MPEPRLSVVIPAAGLARRMKSHGPKALVDVAGESLIGRQVRLVEQVLPGAEIIVVLGHEAGRIRRRLPRHVRTVVNVDFADTNVARSIGLALRACVNSCVLVLYGDLVFNEQALLPFAGPGRPDRCAVLLAPAGDMRDGEVGVNVIDGQVSYFCYSLQPKWAQVLFLTGRGRHLFQQLALAPGRARHFGYEVLNSLLEQEVELLALAPPGLRVVEVDSSSDLYMAREIAWKEPCEC